MSTSAAAAGGGGSNKKAARDPFLDLEEEVERTFHIIQQSVSEHRALLSHVPSSAAAAASASSSNSGPLRPADLQWSAVTDYALLRSLDRLCDDVSQELVPDAAADVQLLRAIVEKHVQGDIGGTPAAIPVAPNKSSSSSSSSVSAAAAGGAGAGVLGEEDVLSGDEVARRVAVLHSFERKLNRAKSDSAEMCKFREFRHMQISPDVYGYYQQMDGDSPGNNNHRHQHGTVSPPSGDDASRYLTPQGQTRVISRSPAHNNLPNANAAAAEPPHTNEFAANFVRQELAAQEKIATEHGEILGMIHANVISADQKAKMIATQIAESRAKLGFVERSMDTIQGKLDSGIQSTNKLLDATGDKGKLAMICCLSTLLMLLLLGLFSGNGAKRFI